MREVLVHDSQRENPGKALHTKDQKPIKLHSRVPSCKQRLAHDIDHDRSLYGVALSMQTFPQHLWSTSKAGPNKSVQDNENYESMHDLGKHSEEGQVIQNFEKPHLVIDIVCLRYATSQNLGTSLDLIPIHPCKNST